MTHTFSHTHYDAVIVGARCAGAATALLLARQGARVLLVDRDPAPGDTISTHALMRPAITLLDAWGVLPAIAEGGTPAVQQTRFVYGDQAVEVPIAPAGRAEGLYAPRRTLLDKALRDAALTAGAEFQLGTAFEDVIRDGSGRVTGAVLRSRWGVPAEVSSDIVIGADGRLSAVAKAVGAQVTAQAGTACATIYGYVPGVPNEGYRWYFAPGLAGGAIPTTGGDHCVFLSCRQSDAATRFGADPLQALASGIAGWEVDVARAVRRAAPRLRRYGGAPGHIRNCAGQGWALVGDAGYFKDPVTAHGITDALLDAHRLAAAIAGPGEPAAYQAARDAHAPAMLSLTHRIAALDWSLDQVRAMHLDLARLIKAEGAALAIELDAHRRAA